MTDGLVWCFIQIDDYRSLSRLPFGRDAKRSSALLRALEREKPFPAARA
ncbi:MAG: hypothetical protein P8179_05855 [Candidatus Thiodiazotropha sp.]